MLLWLLVKLRLRKKPKVLQLLEEIPYRMGVLNSRVARMASKQLSIIYWYEIIFKKSVFRRELIDYYDPVERLKPLFWVIDGLVLEDGNLAMADEAKHKLMMASAENDTTINIIEEKYPEKTNLMDDIFTAKEAKTRGFWNS